jgi:hypothetical protein
MRKRSPSPRLSVDARRLPMATVRMNLNLRGHERATLPRMRTKRRSLRPSQPVVARPPRSRTRVKMRLRFLLPPPPREDVECQLKRPKMNLMPRRNLLL